MENQLIYEMFTESLIKGNRIPAIEPVGLRQGLMLLVTTDHITSLLGKVYNGEEFMELFSHHHLDVKLKEIQLLRMNKMITTRMAYKMIPDLKMIAFTRSDNEEFCFTMNTLTVKQFLLKSNSLKEIENSIQKIINGENYLSDEILKRILTNMVRTYKNLDVENYELTVTEAEVLKLTCKGLSNEEIAHKLFISPISVKINKLEILKKFNRQFNFNDKQAC